MRTSEESERPGPGETYNPGAPRPARQAASVILLRGGAEKLEVLLVRRTPQARFMGGVWVFPGGAVDAEEGDGDGAHRAAALRELREEAAIALEDPAGARQVLALDHPRRGADPLRHALLPRRTAAGQEPTVDGEECVDLGWFTPTSALEAYRGGEIQLVFPTIKHLEQLSDFSSVEEVLSYARGREVQPVQPRVILEGEVARILLPGEPATDRLGTAQACCCGSITCVTALISARCVNACG